MRYLKIVISFSLCHFGQLCHFDEGDPSDSEQAKQIT